MAQAALYVPLPDGSVSISIDDGCVFSVSRAWSLLIVASWIPTEGGPGGSFPSSSSAIMGGIGRVQGIIMAVVVLVAFLAVLPTIISSTVTASGTTGIDAATVSIVNLIPLVTAVGGIGVAGLIAFQAIRGGGK